MQITRTKNNTPSIMQQAILLAHEAHDGQKIAGSSIPYFEHVVEVAQEVLEVFDNKIFHLHNACMLAILHDTIEDTNVTYSLLEEKYGEFVAEGVLALTKNTDLPKEEQMKDSLTRILKHSNEARIVKMADRISNLKQPPAHWNDEKRLQYLYEAIVILSVLRGVCPKIENKLIQRIKDYPAFIANVSLHEEAQLITANL